jgi:hypothetical protein
VKLTQRACEDVWYGRTYNRCCKEHGEVAHTGCGDCSQDDGAGATYEGGSNEHESALLSLVGDPGSDQGTEESDKVRRG